ncbi:LexA family transcriptional regulator [Noviherbaspirillum sp. UKPF54]|uniref:LexA family protein n=1 Tax=Noviherbaspirillum sp. UKPF54 TaxID=2601898 RepID=UPI0011B1409F|nr:translesion error-prone DNA polymerase V autoproteolytic subunit [Noviherbaspirillum sp. UKPF54]QDZ26563.1 translesion error-prone DNA polymerase V autoproteolytic subunit [Noviherbaspirillum sp. UKPF54]
MSSQQDPVPLDVNPLVLTQFGATVRTGFPSPAADHSQKRIDLNAHLLLNPEASFLFRVRGDSMINVGIFDGDTIVVDRSIEPKHRHIVLAIVDEEFTVKRLYRRGKTIRLLAENPAYPPIDLKDGQELRVWGVVTYNLRKLLNG